MKKIGIVGLIISALCCFTPLLGIVLGLIGISAGLAYADYILLPSLVFFAALTIFAFMRKTPTT